MMPADLKSVAIERLQPHPDNPRVVMREDVIASILAGLGDQYPKKYAIHVRPWEKGYQILAGHTRTEAARRKGLTHVWAWVEELDDQAAFMELVTSNNQGELAPLEIGIHALKAVPKEQGKKGGGLKDYAKALGKTGEYVGQLRQAAEVLSAASKLEFGSFLDKAKHLCALHKLPRQCWADACEWLATADESVADVEKRVAAVLEFRGGFDPGGWAKYLPPDACTSAVFAGGKNAGFFHNLLAVAEKFSEELAEHADLRDQWREWLEGNAGGVSWDRQAVGTRRAELEDVLLERDRATAAGEDDHGVLHGDFRHVARTLGDGSVDLIFTDPPYHREYLPLYGDLAAEAARVLKPGGSLVCYLGQYQIHEVCALVTPHLRLWWTLCCLHTGPSARMTEYGIVVKWKPMLWFVKGTRGDKHTFVDDLVISAREKDTHEWQQGIPEAAYYIDKLTLPGGVVFDPFCGGGTTAAAAKATGRRWVTCDVDADSVAAARARLGEVTRGEVA